MTYGQRVLLPGGGVTWTVLGADGLPHEAYERFLAHHRIVSAPNTVRAYATSLGCLDAYLRAAGLPWDRVGRDDLGRFVQWLRFGVPPGVVDLAVAGREPVHGEATVELRIAAVVAFYEFMAEEGAGPKLALHRSARKRIGAGQPYMGFLHHLSSRRVQRTPVLRVRRRRRERPPVLTPAQVQAILEACASWDADAGAWRGSLRNRLLFALLAETGMRLGESLCLFHDDFVAGRGDTPYVLVTPREHPHQQRVKGWRSRRIYVSDRLEALHGDYLWDICDRGAAEAVPNLSQWWLFVNVDQPPLFAPMRPETVYDTVRRIKTRLGKQIPAEFTPHWLRHTHATALLMSGAPMPVVQHRMGHADVQTTINTYGWVTEDAALRALAGWQSFAGTWNTPAATT
jgi:site-specific recombinase XerD